MSSLLPIFFQQFCSILETVLLLPPFGALVFKTNILIFFVILEKATSLHTNWHQLDNNVNSLKKFGNDNDNFFSDVSLGKTLMVQMLWTIRKIQVSSQVLFFPRSLFWKLQQQVVPQVCPSEYGVWLLRCLFTRIKLR